ncbi:MAG: alpha/beta hydrolase [Ilumatobacter sp.]|nr:alpha/beta hydrolase [Ilumatobacter sp.]
MEISTDIRGIRAPAMTTRMMEAMWPAEAAGFLTTSPLLRRIGRGDGHPVLILPGFTTSDLSTRQLRGVLRANGYRAHGWLLGRNIGPTDRIITGVRERIEELVERHGRPITLIGWSLGGIFARAMARERPDLVRQVIVLVSPFRITEYDRSSLDGIYERLAHRHDGDLELRELREQERPPLDVPSTSIYTRTDGMVAWQLCIDEVGPQSENIEIYSSHIGVVLNPSAIYAVLDRLRQPEGEWRPFQPPFALRPWYPHPATWHELRAAA